MAIDIQPISCPQCGANDVEMLSEVQGVCKTCGSQFIVEHNMKRCITHMVRLPFECSSYDLEQKRFVKYNAGAYNAEYEIREVSSEYDERDFIREAWIALAEEDAPFEFFNSEFSNVSTTVRQVLTAELSVEITYKASIGYDRKEAYTDYETYYETVNGKRVKKQRKVTKYRTVTDWKPLSGKHRADSMISVDNITGSILNDNLTECNFNSVQKESLHAPDNKLDICVNKNAADALGSAHSKHFKESLESSLPGDHHKDLDYQVVVKKCKAILYIAPEYKASILCNSWSVAKKAFPFGRMKIYGDEFPKRQSEESAWQSLRPIYWLSIALLVASIIASVILLIANGTTNTTALSVLIISAVALILSKIYTLYSNWKKKAIRNETGKKELELLNRKLQHLGFETLKEDRYGF